MLVVGFRGNKPQQKSWSLGPIPEAHTQVRPEDRNGSFPAVCRETRWIPDGVGKGRVFAAMHGKTWDRGKHVTQRS